MKDNTESLTFVIKTILSSSLVHREGNNIYLDVKEFKEENLSEYELFLGDPLTFVSLCKTYVKELFGLSEKSFKLRNFDEYKDISNIRKEDLGKICKFRGLINKMTKIMLEL